MPVSKSIYYYRFKFCFVPLVCTYQPHGWLFRSILNSLTCFTVGIV